LTLKSTYSDNIELSESDANSDLNIRVSSRFGIKRSGRYNKLSLDYGVSFQKYLDTSTNDTLKHDLTGKWSSELYKDTLFLDVQADAGQSLISNSGVGTGDDINNTGNTTQTFRYSITPYTRHRFGRFADLEVRVTHDQVIYDDVSSGDSTSQSIQTSLSSGRHFGKLEWDLNGSARQVNQDDDGDDDEFRELRLQVGYVLNRTWKPSLYIGWEDNEIEADSEKTSGVIYGAGVTWTPGPRTKMSFRYGHRFFGEDWSLSFNHRQRRSAINLSYSRELSSSRDELLSDRTFQLFDSLGNPISSPALDQVSSIDLSSAGLRDDNYVLDRFDLGYTLKIRRRDTLSFNTHYTKRDSQSTGGDETGWGLGASWEHGLAANLNGTLSASWERLDDDSGNDDRWDLKAGINYRLSVKTSMGFELRHASRATDVSGSDYSENRATLTLSTSW
jgi:uncharacterized protein (PEP-CTERM system associated)